MRALPFMLLTIAASVQSQNAMYRHFDDPGLIEGRRLWLEDCEGCLGYGIGGAPVPMLPET